MFERRDHETSFQHVLRVIARAAGVICLAIIVLFLIGEDLVFGYMSSREWVGFLFFPIGVFVGLVLSFREELMGGMITVASVLSFYLVYGLLLNSSIEQGWALLPFLVPGVLFVAYGLFRSSARHVVAR
jgi:glucose-6-phosphate-specific signal transduction histidine kinase